MANLELDGSIIAVTERDLAEASLIFLNNLQRQRQPKIPGDFQWAGKVIKQDILRANKGESPLKLGALKDHKSA